MYSICANNLDPGRAHYFEAYTPFEGADPHFERLLFCHQCGEVRELILPPMEPSADQRGVARRRRRVKIQNEDTGFPSLEA